MPSLADAIIAGDVSGVAALVQYGGDVNEIDKYGLTPLIEAAIVDNIEIVKILLRYRADPNLKDVTGGSALQWAAENNNLALCKLLLTAGANPNTYNFSGQPVLVMPILRQHHQLKKLLISAGADLTFAQDFINTKLLGHMFELVGIANIISPDNKFVEMDFEGFYLEVTLAIISESLFQFQNHFAARQLRRYAGLSLFIVEILNRALQLIKYQQYRVDKKKYQSEIENILKHEPVIIPVGYEGHAITFIKRGDIWIKCDRREDSRLYDNIVFYHIDHPPKIELLKHLIYEGNSFEFINQQLDQMLGLRKISELKIDSQISGNCSWANVEACIPAIFYLVLMQMSHDPQALSYHKTLAVNYYHRWREWNKDRALDACIQSFKDGDAVRKATKAEILAAILFQRCNWHQTNDNKRVDKIINVFISEPKYQYILKNYVRTYYYNANTPEGKDFYEMLKERDFMKL